MALSSLVSVGTLLPQQWSRRVAPSLLLGTGAAFLYRWISPRTFSSLLSVDAPLLYRYSRQREFCYVFICHLPLSPYPFPPPPPLYDVIISATENPVRFLTYARKHNIWRLRVSSNSASSKQSVWTSDKKDSDCRSDTFSFRRCSSLFIAYISHRCFQYEPAT